MDERILHPAAVHHLPPFITAPGEPDVLMVVAVVSLAVCVVGFGVLYLRLHALPEQVAHKGKKVQLEIVAILALIALFTHMHIFWIAGLLLAFVDIPDLGGFLGRIAGAVERMSGMKGGASPEGVGATGRPLHAADAGHPDAEASAPRDPPRAVAGRKEGDHA